ncbi:hypothetical protein D3C72_1439120 [compost metagenome]
MVAHTGTAPNANPHTITISVAPAMPLRNGDTIRMAANMAAIRIKVARRLRSASLSPKKVPSRPMAP